ncbi:MAG: T9SS type A sorting domain-containing protein [Tenuifilaceae bacterium]
MKKVLLIIFTLIITTSIQYGQDLSWSKHFSGAGSLSAPLKLVTDNSGGIYLIGNFTGALNIGGNTYTSSGSSDAIVVKLTKSGAIRWVNTINGSALDNATGIAINATQDAIVVNGFFTNTGTFTSKTGGSKTLTSTDAQNDAFIVAYDTTGTIVGSPIRFAYGTNIQRSHGIKIDKDGNYVVFGIFVNNIQFLNTSLSPGGTVAYNYIAKLSANGNVIWNKYITGPGTSFNSTRIIALDITDDAYYYIGNFQSSIVIDTAGIPTTLTSAGVNDIFIYKTDYSGTGKYYRQIGGTSDDLSTSISSDKTSNLFFSGYFSSASLSIDSTFRGSTMLKSTRHPFTVGSNDILLGKFRNDGLLQWIKNGGTTGDDKLNRATFGEGFFVAAGTHNTTFTFENQSILHSTGSNSDFLGLVHDDSDNLIYAINLGGSGTDLGQNATIDAYGSYIFVADFTSPTITIGSSTYTNGGGNDLLIVKYLKGSLDKFSSNITCKGSANGTIHVDARGPLVEPFTYTWDKGGTPFTPADPHNPIGLTAGTYNLVFSDAEGFTINETFTITEPAAVLAVSVNAQTNVACFGQATGSVTLSATGGTSPYTYNKDGGAYQGSVTFSTLRADNYTFGVKDANGCTSIVNATITEPATALSVTTTGTADNGTSNGTATATPAGGTTPYTYSWNSAPVQTTQTATGLPAGTYTGTVTDNKGCTASSTIGISSFVAAISSKTDVTCNGANDGAATVSVTTGGVAPFTYSWNTTPVRTSQSVTGLAPGTYTVTVTDSDSPAKNASTSVVISEPAVLTASLNKTDITCISYSDGSIETTVTGGTAPYTYTWTKDGGSYAATANIFNLGKATYELTLKDVNNCQDIKSSTLSTTQSNLVVNLSPTHAKCYLNQGSISGSIASSVSGAFGAYTYLWNNGKTTAGITANPGNYSLTVTDALGCQSIATSSINYGPQISGGVDILNTPCAGTPNGSVKFTPILSGNGNLTYLWNNSQTTQTISNLGPANYSVTVADIKNCQYQSSTILTEYTLPTATLSGTAAICAGTSTNLTITLTGSAPWNVTYNAGTTPVVINGINTSPHTISVSPSATIVYSITAVSDSHCNGTSFGASATVTVNPLPVPTITGTSPICEFTTGSIYSTEASMTGYSWTITGGTIASGGTATDNTVTIDWGAASTGSVKVNYIDGNGCTAAAQTNKTVTIRPLPLATISPNGPQSICTGNNITINANTGLGLTYEWYKDASIIIGSTNSYLDVSTEGVYNVKTTNIFSCSQTSTTATITLKPVPTASISTIDKTTWCADETVSVNITATLVTGATYQWYKNSIGISGATGSTYRATQAGTYNLQVTLNGCVATSSDIVVIVNPLPLSALSTTDPLAYCADAIVNTTFTAAPADGDSFQWYLDGTAIDGATSINYTANAGGVYTVKVTEIGCSATSTPTTIIINSLPVVYNASFNKVCIDAAPITLSGGTPAGGVYTMGGAPIVTFDPSVTGAGDFTITYTYTDGNNCTSFSDSILTVYAALSGGSIGSDQAICSGGDPDLFTSSTDPAGGDGIWTYSWESLVGSGSWTQITNTNSLTFDVPSGLTETTQYRRVATNGCGIAYSNEIIVTVNPLPTVTLSAFASICEGSSIFALTGGDPVGGVYSGTGVTGSDFDPITAGIGTHTITYTFTDAVGCANSANSTITVNPLPIVTVSPTGKTAYCQDETISTLLTATPSGATSYQWRINDVDIASETNETYTAISAGTYSVVVVDVNSCSGLNSIDIIANALPVIDIAPGVDTIKIKTNEQHTFDAGAGFATYLWNDGSSNQTLMVDGATFNPGDYTYWAEVTNAAGCIARDTAILNVSWPTSIETEKDWSVTIFPNPTNGEFKLNLTGLKSNKVEITIHNSSGMIVFKKEYKTSSNELHELINVGNNSKGIYLVRISDKQNYITRKIILE